MVSSEAKISDTVTRGAVSYTHLDVYKRQNMYIARNINITL